MGKISFFISEVLAQTPGQGTITVPPPPGTASEAEAIGPLLGQWFSWIITAAIILSVVMIAIGGVQYITSSLPGGKSNGKDRIWNAIWGLILAFAAYFILKTINPDLVNLTFPELK